MPSETVLEEATRILVERQATYGSPQKNHAMTAALWSAYLGIAVSARDVCLLNCLQKVARDRCGKPKRDNMTDLAGFAQNADIVSEAETKKSSSAPAPASVGFGLILPPGTRVAGK